MRALSPDLTPIHSDEAWPHLGGCTPDLAWRCPWASGLGQAFLASLPTHWREGSLVSDEAFDLFWEASALTPATIPRFVPRTSRYVAPHDSRMATYPGPTSPCPLRGTGWLVS